MLDIEVKIKQKLTLLTKENNIELSLPPNSNMGDYSFPCFSLAKKLKKDPSQIAKELQSKFSLAIISKTIALGPYLNFFLNRPQYIKLVLKEIKNNSADYGSGKVGKNKKILLEHTSINPNASPHVGRARNALLGDSIARICRFQGFDVNVHYFVNDVGKQIALIVHSLGDKRSPKFSELLELYVRANNMMQNDPKIEQEVFSLLKKLENGDKKTLIKFKKVVDVCIKGQQKIFNELDIRYDKFDYESDYLLNNKTKKILEKFQKTGKLFEDENKRLVLNQEEYNLPLKAPYFVLTRKDKTSIYPLRDLAYTLDKINSAPYRNIIILGEDHKLYFEQLKAALDLLGKKAPEPVHYSFVLLVDSHAQKGSEKMSTRKGNVVLLEDFMNEAQNLANKEIAKRHDKASSKSSKAIAYAAVKYALLRVSNDKNVIFDFDKALTFEGETGPYMLYTYARIKSILRKAKIIGTKSPNLELLTQESEFLLARTLDSFPDSVDQAFKRLSPHIIANYCFSLCQRFSDFYHNCPVLAAQTDLMQARLELIQLTAGVLKQALNLIGINTVEKM